MCVIAQSSLCGRSVTSAVLSVRRLRLGFEFEFEFEFGWYGFDRRESAISA
jgi:hypothetical protein